MGHLLISLFGTSSFLFTIYAKAPMTSAQKSLLGLQFKISKLNLSVQFVLKYLKKIIYVVGLVTMILGFSRVLWKSFPEKVRCQKSRCEGYMSGLRGSLASDWSIPRQFWSLIGQWVSVSFEAWFRQWRENQYYPRLGQPGRTVTRELRRS